ncbi:MAG: glutamate--cysteine ligase, partial [Baekduiaceae bacterium]
TAPVRAELGLTDLRLPERNGAQRQRALLAEGATMEEAFARSVQETQVTYANTPQEAPSR